MMHVSKGSMDDRDILVPPLPEQQRIVAILDEAFDGISTAKANAEKNLQNARALFESHTTKLLSYCVALANEGGGYLVLGVTDKPPRQVVGSQAFLAASDLNSVKALIVQKLRIRVDAVELAHPDGRVLVFDVPSRPVGQPLDFDGAYLMRAGEELVPMTPDKLRRIFAEGEPDWFSQAAKLEASADEVIALLDTQAYFDLLYLPYPVNRAGVLERFESEKLIQNQGDVWTITNLGGILFAKKLDQFEGLARKAPRVIVYEGKSKLKTKLDKPGSKGYAVGFQGLVEFINGLASSNEVIE